MSALSFKSQIVIASLLAAFSCAASARDRPPVTVTVTEPPVVFAGYNEIRPLATITITENHPKALRDGSFVLRGRENAEQIVRFSTQTTPTGSVASHRFALANTVLIIDVDADDRRIDTITIQPMAYVQMDSSWNNFTVVSMALQDGNEFLVGPVFAPTPTGLGSAEGSYHVATYAGYNSLFGSETTLSLAMNETVTLPLYTSQPSLTSVYSLDPAVATVDSYSAAGVVITGRSPGQTQIRASNPVGSSTGLLYVTVSPPVAPPPPRRPVTPPGPPVTPPAFEGGNHPVFSGGVLPRGIKEFKSAPSPNEVVSVAAQIEPAPENVNQFADLFMIVEVTTPAGFTAWYQKNSSGQFVPWNGSMTELVPVQEGVLLSESERLEVFNDQMAPGQYRVYVGYLADDSPFIHSPTPLTVDVK